MYIYVYIYKYVIIMFIIMYITSKLENRVTRGLAVEIAYASSKSINNMVIFLNYIHYRKIGVQQ